MSEPEVIQRVRRIALEEARLSAAGTPGTFRVGGNNNVKYNTSYHGREVSDPTGIRFAWCVVFIWWVMRKAGVPAAVFPKKASVFRAPDGGVRAWFKARDRYKTASSKPEVGDLVVFKRSHIGIVERVDATTIFTVEGNAGNRVRRRSYRRTNPDIDGYCRPAYELVEDDMTTDELLAALKSERGQAILREAVRHELRVATGPDDASEPAGKWFGEVLTKIREIRARVN
jgi:CHAP domain-containing protein